LSEMTETAEMTEAEAARRALDVAAQLLGTNPARVEQAERQRDRWRGILTDLLEIQTDTQKQDTLVRAARDGKDGVVGWLLAAGVDPSATASAALAEVDLDGDTALTACVKGGHVESLELLLCADAKVERQGRGGASPLALAAYHGQAACVERLLGAGAAADAQNRDGDTPLLYAIVGGHEEVVAALLRAGCGVDLWNSRGVTPLTMAARLDRAGIVERLLEAGADRRRRNIKGKTALQLAQTRGYEEVVALLRNGTGGHFV